MKLSCKEQFLAGKRSNVGVSHMQPQPAVYVRSANLMYMVLSLILLLLRNTEQPSFENFLKKNLNIFVAPKSKLCLQRLFYFICATPPSFL